MYYFNYITRSIWIVLFLIISVGYFSTFQPCYKNNYHFMATVIICGLWVLFSIIWLWSYFKLCWCDPGSTEKFFMESELANHEQIRILPKCPHCGNPKPARAHHCSDCDRCFFQI